MTLTAAQTCWKCGGRRKLPHHAIRGLQKTCDCCEGTGIQPNPELRAVRTAQTALRTAESHVQQRRQELQAAVLQARETRSLADIARELGVSKQRVDQISRGR